MEDIDVRLMEILERQGRLEEQVKAAFKRIDENKSLVESVHSIALTVERQSSELKTMVMQITALKQDVEELKQKPAKRWEAVIAAAISAIVGLVAGLLFKR